MIKSALVFYGSSHQAVGKLNKFFKIDVVLCKNIEECYLIGFS